jgi:hypothetical protein
MDVPGNPQRPLTDPYVPRYRPPTDEPDTSPVVRAARRISALDILLGVVFGVALAMLALALLPSHAGAAGTGARASLGRASLAPAAPATVTFAAQVR